MINDIVCHMRLRQNILVTFIDIPKINFVLIFLSAQRPMTYFLRYCFLLLLKRVRKLRKLRVPVIKELNILHLDTWSLMLNKNSAKPKLLVSFKWLLFNLIKTFLNYMRLNFGFLKPPKFDLRVGNLLPFIFVLFLSCFITSFILRQTQLTKLTQTVESA